MHATDYLDEVREKEGAVTASLNSYHLIRVFATVTVVMVHATMTAVTNVMPSQGSEWVIGNLYQSFARSCIPLFLMLTGALLLPKAEAGIAFYFKRYKRILIPFVLWSAVYLVAKNPIEELQLKSFFHVLIHGAYYQFWYIYVVAGIYLFLPLMKIFIEKARSSVLTGAFVVWTGCFLVPFLLPNGRLLTIANFILYSGYVAIGFILAEKIITKGIRSKIQRIAFAVFTGGAIVTFVGTFYLTLHDGRLNTLFYESTMPHIFVQAAGSFVFLYDRAVLLSDRAAKLVNWMSKYSFGVFFIHPLVLEHILVTRLGITPGYIHPFIGTFLSTILCVAVSYLLIYLLSRLPFGKYTY